MRLKYFLLLLMVYPTVAFSEEIAFESAVSYKKNDQADFTQAKDGDKIHLDRGDNVFVITKQSLPLFILAPNKSNANITIPDANVNSAVFEQLRPSLEKSTSEIIDGIRKTEGLIQKRDYNQASQVILSLKQKYKNISSILFMSATVRYLLNDKNAATEDLQKGLELDPSNENAKRLLSKLKGGA